MNKIAKGYNITPTDEQMHSFFVLIDTDGARHIYDRKQDILIGAESAGTQIFKADPFNNTFTDETAGMALDWFDAADIYDDAPEIFEAYVADKVSERRDRQEDPRGENDRAEYMRDLMGDR